MGCLTEAWSDNMKLVALLSIALLGVVMAAPGYGHGYIPFGSIYARRWPGKAVHQRSSGFGSRDEDPEAELPSAYGYSPYFLYQALRAYLARYYGLGLGGYSNDDDKGVDSSDYYYRSYGGGYGHGYGTPRPPPPPVTVPPPPPPVTVPPPPPPVTVPPTPRPSPSPRTYGSGYGYGYGGYGG